MKQFFVTLGHAAAGGAAAGGALWLSQGNVSNWKSLIAIVLSSAVTSVASLYTTPPNQPSQPSK